MINTRAIAANLKLKTEIATALLGMATDLESGEYGPEALAQGLEVRLQLSPDLTWQLHTGDAQCDTDHNGHWGECWLSKEDDLQSAEDMAETMLTDALDSMLEDETLVAQGKL